MTPEGSTGLHRLTQEAERWQWAQHTKTMTWLFARENGAPYEPTYVTKTFRKLAIEAGLRRLHDLRHSFAVGCLLRWYRDGLDPSTRLHHLAT